MTAAVSMAVDSMAVDSMDFHLPAALEAHEPPEARGLGRDRVRMLVGRRDSAEISHHTFDELPSLLDAGDVLVVNTSGTMPAAVDVTGPYAADSAGLVVHVSTELPDGTWVVELRRRDGATTLPYPDGVNGQRLQITGGAGVTLLRPYTPGRLWVAALDRAGVPVRDLPGYLMSHGRPIRYGYVDHDWPIAAYRSVFATAPGSAEMPSASRPFTDEIVTRLVSRGIVFAPITLHTGVASPEVHEKPYPERFRVPATTARLVTEARAAGRRIVGVGTTAVRAIETATDARGRVRATGGWTELVVTPERGVRVVDGLITGFHEPRASHLEMLTAIAGPQLLARCYTEALRDGYLWHEFGDINLLLSR